jgi:hypothetical protein
MTGLKISKILNFGLIGSTTVSALSFFIKLIPCKIPSNDSTSLGLCKLPSIFQDISESSNIYYALSNNPLTGLVLQFTLSFLIIISFFYLTKKKPEKIVDLTEKKQ